MDDLKAPREFSGKQRDKLASSGAAMPDGSYPIPDKDALRRAIQAFGRAKNPAATKRHIIKRARALGATSMLPEDWGGAPAKGMSIAAGHLSQAACILEDLYCLISCEADEPEQMGILQQAADLIQRWMPMEQAEIGGPDDLADDDDDMGYGKAIEVKAEDMTTSELDRWLKGERPRRILVLPYGGLIPSDVSPIGVDLDREWFDEQTDHIGPYAALKATRERLVDWHHTTGAGEKNGYRDPMNGTMKGAILGRVVLDEKPDTVTLDRDYRGIWADWWMKFGDQGRRALIEEIERAGGTLYGSTQPVAGGVVKSSNGHIDVWPIQWHTITTNPRNHLAAVPPLKAVLTADLPFDEVGLAALKAALVGLDDLGAELRASSHGGEQSAKARRLSAAIEEAERLLPLLAAKVNERRSIIQ
jgi:hypothetical protein